MLMVANPTCIHAYRDRVDSLTVLENYDCKRLTRNLFKMVQELYHVVSARKYELRVSDTGILYHVHGFITRVHLPYTDLSDAHFSIRL
jgi:hypothetical protein